jgi:hypothetical protein
MRNDFLGPLLHILLPLLSLQLLASNLNLMCLLILLLLSQTLLDVLHVK